MVVAISPLTSMNFPLAQQGLLSSSAWQVFSLIEQVLSPVIELRLLARNVGSKRTILSWEDPPNNLYNTKFSVIGILYTYKDRYMN